MKIFKTNLKYYCLVCHKPISVRAGLYGSQKCSSCSHIKHGKYLIKYFCIDCKKEISSFQHIRCYSCETKRKFKIGILLHTKIAYCEDCSKNLGKWAYNNKSRRCLSCANKGINNPSFNGWISKEPYSLNWTEELRESIRICDNHECQNCGMTEEEHLIVIGKILCVHHIDYNKKNCNEDNLITLCMACNIRANYNRDYWQERFMEIIDEKVKGKEIGNA